MDEADDTSACFLWGDTPSQYADFFIGKGRTHLISKGEMEDKISRALTQWEKEYLGRGPVSVKTDIVRNMVIVLLRGILTPAERKLSNNLDGMLSIKKIRSDLVESGNPELKALLAELTGSAVVSFHPDISTRTGERVILFMMADNLEERLEA